jgi:hypothetical protein
MLDLLKEEFDKILVFVVVILLCLMYYLKPGELTAGWVSAIIGVMATLLTQKISKSITDRIDAGNGNGKPQVSNAVQNVTSTTTVTPKEEVKP